MPEPHPISSVSISCGQAEGVVTDRCSVERLIKTLGLHGVIRGKQLRTTIGDKAAPWLLDRVDREFRAACPNRLWVSGFTNVSTWQGFVYVAFIIDVFARYIVGWRVSRTADTGFVLDALEQAQYQRLPTHRGGLVHHSDRGSQYVAIKYTERLADAGIEPSAGSVCDSYDNALAETINGLYKAELIHRRAPWKSFEAVELATLTWVDWINNRRLMEPIGISHPPRPRRHTMLCGKISPWQRNLNQTASEKPGAVRNNSKLIERKPILGRRAKVMDAVSDEDVMAFLVALLRYAAAFETGLTDVRKNTLRSELMRLTHGAMTDGEFNKVSEASRIFKPEEFLYILEAVGDWIHPAGQILIWEAFEKILSADGPPSKGATEFLDSIRRTLTWVPKP